MQKLYRDTHTYEIDTTFNICIKIVNSYTSF